MPLNLPTLYKRTGSAIVYAAIMLTAILWKVWLFALLICVINFLCLKEYFKLLQRIDKVTYWPKWMPVAFHVISLAIIATGFALYYLPGNPHAGLGRAVDYLLLLLPSLPVMLLVIPVLLCIALLSKHTSFFALTHASGGLLYITLSLSLLFSLRAIYGFVIPLAMILMIWTNDTMAYFVGSFIGKTPFSPISPKKTWEGTIGGGVLTVAGAAIYGFFSHRYRMADWMAWAACAAVAGTIGDLMESKLKRMADVKDSGNIMPGHGGALDRFDSILFATPFVFAYTVYFIK
jgi:phosphatidate cytidylyltransferase